MKRIKLRVLFSCPLLSCSTDDSFSHYSLSVHGCRLSLFYWPDVSAARPVKFLWKLEQVLGGLRMLALNSKLSLCGSTIFRSIGTKQVVQYLI